MSDVEIVENPTTKIPVCLCLDTSGSMYGEPIDALNKGLKSFFEFINNDETTRMATDICIITFGGFNATCVRDYATVSEFSDFPPLMAHGYIIMADAVKLAFEKLAERIKAYQAEEVEYYKPLLVIMTDGYPTDSDSEVEEAIQLVSDLVNNRKLSVFPICIGSNADENKLQQFSPKRSVLHLKGLQFSDFFEWLSDSIASISQSSVDDIVALDTSKIRSWATA